MQYLGEMKLTTVLRYISDSVCDTEFASNMTFKAVTSIINFYIPTGCMVFLYVRIFIAIKRRSNDIARSGHELNYLACFLWCFVDLPAGQSMNPRGDYCSLLLSPSNLLV